MYTERDYASAVGTRNNIVHVDNVEAGGTDRNFTTTIVMIYAYVWGEGNYLFLFFLVIRLSLSLQSI